MSATRLLVSVVSFGFSVAVFAQATPAPGPAAPGVIGGQAAPSQGAAEEEKRAARGKSEQMPSGQRRSNNPGYIPPMDIKIKDAGIALPKCAKESQEGEACKQ